MKSRRFLGNVLQVMTAGIKTGYWLKRDQGVALTNYSQPFEKTTQQRDILKVRYRPPKHKRLGNEKHWRSTPGRVSANGGHY